MINFLSKIFIKNHTNYNDGKVRHAYGMLCSAMGIILNLFISIFKFIAGTISGSIAITADAFNNIADAGSSIITMIGFKLADKKPDPDHPFGHGRMEYISGLIVALAIILMGFELLTGAIEKIISGATTTFSWLSMLILAVSILVKIYMSMFNRNIGKKINSSAMKATATDCLSDCISTTVVLASTLIAHFLGWNIDGWCGLIVSLLVMYAGIVAVKETFTPLLGQPPELEFVQEIEKIILSNPAAVGIHDLVVHDYGPGRRIISVHVEVPASANILEMHDAIDLIEKQLNTELKCIATIHMDPIATDDATTLALKEQVIRIVTEVDPQLSIHDFRIVAGPTHINIIFDTVVPHEFSMTNADLVKFLSQKIHEYGETLRNGREYFAIIHVDMAYV